MDPSPVTREQICNALVRLDTVWVENECDTYDLAVSSLGDQGPQVIFVGIDADISAAIVAIERLARQFEHSRVIAYSRSNEGSLILRAIRAGAKEFLTLPIAADELDAALRNAGAASAPSQCTTIAVAGATGGVGSSSLAVNLASILADDPGKSVVLVDLDVALGDVDVLLDVARGQTLLDVVQNVDRLDFSLLRRSLTQLETGLFLLPRPALVRDAAAITADSLNRLLVQLQASFSHVILDLSKGYTALDSVALDHCDTVLLVTQLTLPSLRNVVRLQHAFGEIENLNDRLRIVVNRCGLQSPVRLKKAQEIMGREIFWRVPNDHQVMMEACNQGVPLIQLAPRAELTLSLLAMAERLAGPAQAGKLLSPAAVAPAATRWRSLWPAARQPAFSK